MFIDCNAAAVDKLDKGIVTLAPEALVRFVALALVDSAASKLDDGVSVELALAVSDVTDVSAPETVAPAVLVSGDAALFSSL